MARGLLGGTNAWLIESNALLEWTRRYDDRFAENGCVTLDVISSRDYASWPCPATRKRRSRVVSVYPVS